MPELAFTTVDVKLVPFTIMYTVQPLNSKGPQDTHTSVVSDAMTVVFKGPHARSATGRVVSTERLLLTMERGRVLYGVTSLAMGTTAVAVSMSARLSGKAPGP